MHMGNNSPRKVILDTDMGVDCDDAVALALLLNKHIAGEIDLVCVTASSTREGATGTIKAICNYYGVKLEIGAMAVPALKCDMLNNYGKAVKDFYHTEDETQDAVQLLRKTLAGMAEKCTLILIGPVSNMERLLKSEPDEFSPLGGEQLVRETVAEIYSMGGCFEQNCATYGMEFTPEWNIVQDIPAAQYFVAHCPVRVTFVPWEAGASVMTVMGQGDNPVWYSMLQYAISEKYPYEPTYERMSWDPVTCLCATEGCEEYYDYSEAGTVSVDDQGRTIFREEKDGKFRILLLKDGYQRIADKINASVEPIWKRRHAVNERIRSPWKEI